MNLLETLDQLLKPSLFCSSASLLMPCPHLEFPVLLSASPALSLPASPSSSPVVPPKPPGHRFAELFQLLLHIYFGWPLGQCWSQPLALPKHLQPPVVSWSPLWPQPRVRIRILSHTYFCTNQYVTMNACHDCQVYGRQIDPARPQSPHCLFHTTEIRGNIATSLKMQLLVSNITELKALLDY